MPYSAGEAVGPNAMSPAEFSAQAGAVGGEAPSTSSPDWGQLLSIFAQSAGTMGQGSGGAPLMGASNPVMPSQASPIQFQTVAQFLQSLPKIFTPGGK